MQRNMYDFHDSTDIFGGKFCNVTTNDILCALNMNNIG